MCKYKKPAVIEAEYWLGKIFSGSRSMVTEPNKGMGHRYLVTAVIDAEYWARRKFPGSRSLLQGQRSQHQTNSPAHIFHV